MATAIFRQVERSSWTGALRHYVVDINSWKFNFDGVSPSRIDKTTAALKSPKREIKFYDGIVSRRHLLQGKHVVRNTFLITILQVKLSKDVQYLPRALGNKIYGVGFKRRGVRD